MSIMSHLWLVNHRNAEPDVVSKLKGSIFICFCRIIRACLALTHPSTVRNNRPAREWVCHRWSLSMWRYLGSRAQSFLKLHLLFFIIQAAMVTKTAHVSQKQSLMGNGQESTLHRGHLLALEQKRPRTRHMLKHLSKFRVSSAFLQPCLKRKKKRSNDVFACKIRKRKGCF